MHTLIFTALIFVTLPPHYDAVNVVHDFRSRESCLEAGRFLAEAAPKDSKVTWVCQEQKATRP